MDKTNKTEGAPEEKKETRSMEQLLSDVPLEFSVELGRVTLSMRDLAARLGPGSVIAIGKQTGDRLDIRVNGHLVARGEAVTVGDRYGVRISEILGQEGGNI